jgi:hypothetical protein
MKVSIAVFGGDVQRLFNHWHASSITKEADEGDPAVLHRSAKVAWMDSHHRTPIPKFLLACRHSALMNGKVM